MDVISSETSDENGCIERPVRTRRSSILKPPRSPLQDLNGGNERVQESNALRNKKNTRRVSFADTIKVFQTESHVKFKRNSEHAETEAGENVPFIQNKNLDDNYCEITGMDTLLCAPIQAQMQHREISITELNHERKHENDQTVIFSDENQMDLTASHTVIINNDPLDCTKGQKSNKIDTSSFLANLKLHTENSRMKNEFKKISMDQNTSSENKINFSDFIKNLKREKSNDFPSSFSSNKENYFSSDKENIEVHTYSKNSNRTSTMYQKHASLNVEENSTNMTRIFRDQDDGMNFTQCHTANIQTLVPSANEARLREFKCDDTTIYGNDFMDLTVNHTIQILPSVDNLSKSESQTKDVWMDGTTHCGTDAPEKKTVFKNKLNDALNPECKTDISRSHIIRTEIDTVTPSSNQETRTLAMTSESTLFSPGRQDYKTVFYSTCNDAMELTKCVSIKEKNNLLNHDSNFSNMYPNPDAISLFIDKTIYSGETSMDITKSHTVAIDNQIFKQDQTNVQMAAIPVSEKEVAKKTPAISENGGMIVNCSSVSHVSKERLQQSLGNPLSISLIDKKTEIFMNEDMDLTESHTTNLGCQPSLTSSNPAPENICKRNSHSKSPSDEWVFLSEGQSALKNPNTTVNSHTLKSIPDQNSKLPDPPRKSLGNPIPGCLHNKATVCSEEKQNMDLTKSHTVVIGFVPSEEQKLGKTNLEYINSQLTTVSRQIAVDVEKCINVSIEKKCIANDMDILEVKSVQKSGLLSEKKDVEICERKSGSLKVDKTIVFSEIDENDMDITKSCTVETNHRPFLEHDSCLMPLAGTSKTVLYSCGQDDMEITRSHTTILQCKTLSPDKITTRPMDKTIIFVDNQDELEMTKSHTVFNVFHTNEKTAPLDRSNCELYKKNSLEKPKVVSVPAEESAFFQKNDEGDHSAAKVSRLTLAGEWSNTGSITKAVEVIDDDMKVSKSNIWEYNQDIQRPGLLNEPPGKGQKRKSLRLKNDKTIAFSKSDDDMDIGQSCMMKRNNESALKDGEDSRLLPLAGTSKTILYTDDMEITKSYTTALEYKTLSPDKKTTRPMNNSVMFVDNQSALEVTKSHTVFIDCPATRDFLQKCPEFGIAKRKTLDASFPEGGRSVQDVTKNQEEARESSHETAICGSIDNHSSLSNVSCFKNLHGNDKFLSDKTKKSSDYPMQNDLTFANNLAVEYYSKSEGQPLSACLSEKEKFIQTKGQLDYAITLFKDQDLIKDSKNQLADQTLVYSQDLGKMTIINSEQVSLKIPEAQKEPFINNAAHDVKKISVDNVCLVSQPHFTTQQLPSLQQGQCIVNKDETIFSKAVNNLDTVPRNSSVPAFENKSKILNSEKKFAVACEKEQEKNIETAQHHTAVDFSNNPDLTKQFNETLANPREESDSIISSNIESYNIKPNLNDLNGTDFKTAPISCSPEQLFELVNRAHGNMVQATEIHNISTVTNKVNDDGAKENNTSHNVAKANPVPRTVRKDKVKRYSLGIFLPRLPNKRNCSVTDMDDLDQMPADAADLNCVETQPVSGKASGIGFVTTELNLSPSQYINEENLPIDPGEINFLDSISLEMDEKALSETNQKEISSSENKMEENCNSHKRTWVQEEYDTQNEKKIKKHDIRFTDTTTDQKISDDHAEGNIDKTTNSVSRTPSSCSSSLDSIKADGTSLDFSTHRNSQMESQFLTDTICEESLKEKLKDGRITLKEFFILLQVHILIQKPRQSKLPAKFTVNSPATPEDLMLSQYVYRPKIQIYKEDCDALHQKIEELKLSALNQDKLLTDVNKNLWEKMKHCSDEELKAFGNYLNKIKSRFTKMTKVFTHQGKVTLYSKLVQSAKNEREKLQIRINKMDNTLKKIDNCLTEVEIETKDLDCEEKDNTIKGWDSEMRAAEKELEQLKTKEEELKRNLLELEVQRGQILNQIDSIQKQTSKTNELLDQLSLSEWDVIEWSDDQAVFTFLYDTIELNIIFGETEVGLPFLDKSSRKIIDLNFQSLLDENEAPSSSLLVHKLIFQYIEGQESWKKKCATQLQVPKMLQEISLIVSHCRLLGEEIEFLKRWGANYNLMSIDVNNTELKLLFSSSAAFAKFEITLSLSACYPSVPLPFTFQNHIGNIGKDKITAILSKVPLEDNYLKNVVKQIYQDLLQNCSFYSIDGPRQYQA
ncbi:kinetochore scaffold 1 [Sorex araneus]|uniref:kinetochore scaffold 1 n=1 Tax=Sorex araneus TaxID=42254 RepID=UPI0024338A80|nr:kinetochore scaffold 1 [Sorex araneus]